MLIYIGNLPRHITLIELGSILGGDDMKVRGSSHQGKRIDNSEYHCILVDTDNDDTGQQLIQKVDGLELHGHALAARRYIDRTKSSWQGEDRRIQQLDLDFPEGKVSPIR